MQPETEAGRRLLTDLTDLDRTGAAPTSMYLGPTGVLRAILSIEAEAQGEDPGAPAMALHTCGQCRKSEKAAARRAAPNRAN